MKRKELASAVQARLNKGAKKETIYNELKEKFGAAAVERSLAQWPYPADKKKNLYLNVPLLIINGFFALLTILQIAGGAGRSANGLLLLLIQLYILYGLKNCNLIAYLLVMLFGARALIGIAMAATYSPQIMMLMAFNMTAIALAWIQKARLFPNTSILLRHKRDANGNPIF